MTTPTNRTFLQRRLASWGMDCRAVARRGAAPSTRCGDAAARRTALPPRAARLQDAGYRRRPSSRRRSGSTRRSTGFDLLMLTSSGQRAQPGAACWASRASSPSRFASLVCATRSPACCGGSPPSRSRGRPVGAPDAARSAGEPGQRAVLVAEDNPVNQLVASRLLEQRGLSVDLAANGREAVDKHRKRGYERDLHGLPDARARRLPGHRGDPRVRGQRQRTPRSSR